VLCQIVIGLNLHGARLMGRPGTLADALADLQLYAGARTQLGLAVDPRLVEIAKAKVSGWALTHEGRVAAWHSAHFLRSVHSLAAVRLVTLSDCSSQALPEARSITQPTSLYYSWVRGGTVIFCFALC
jgi:hypothetical protein